jgi:hypothetical protein
MSGMLSVLAFSVVIATILMSLRPEPHDRPAQ